MVRFPGPFTKKGKKKRARANGQEDTPRSGYSSAEEATDFYSDLEEACTVSYAAEPDISICLPQLSHLLTAFGENRCSSAAALATYTMWHCRSRRPHLEHHLRGSHN